MYHTASHPRHVKYSRLFSKWYGGEHKAPALQAEAVYGLTELARDEVRGARLVANPGCYPTAAQLPLIALLKVRSLSLRGASDKVERRTACASRHFRPKGNSSAAPCRVSRFLLYVSAPRVL